MVTPITITALFSCLQRPYDEEGGAMLGDNSSSLPPSSVELAAIPPFSRQRQQKQQPQTLYEGISPTTGEDMADAELANHTAAAESDSSWPRPKSADDLTSM